MKRGSGGSVGGIRRNSRKSLQEEFETDKVKQVTESEGEQMTDADRGMKAN